MKKYVSAAVVKLTKTAKVDLARKTEDPRLLYRLVFDPEIDVVTTVVRNKATPEAALFVAADVISGINERWDRDKALRNTIDNPNCGDNLLKYIISKGYCTSGEIAGAILNKSQSDDVVSTLCDSSDATVREAVASRCEKLTPEQLDKLAYDVNDNVRYAMANRQDASPDLLEVLVYDPSSRVISAAVSNANIPKAVKLEFWSDFDNYEMLASIANYGIHTGLDASDITSEELKPVVNFVYDLPNMIDTRCKKFVKEVAVELATNPNTPVSELVKLCSLPCDSDDGDIACGIVERYTGYRYSNYRYDNGNYKELPKSVQALLESKCISGEYQNADLIRRLAAFSKNPDFLRVASRKGSSNDRWSSGYYCRLEAARNKYTPIDCLEALRKDNVQDVRMEAQKTLTKVSKSSTIGPASNRKSTGWAVSPYNMEAYSEIADDLNDTIPKVMERAGKTLGTKLTYQFDSDDYDEVSELTITADNGKTVTLDAQRFLAQLTSDNSMITGTNRVLKYIEQVFNTQ